MDFVSDLVTSDSFQQGRVSALLQGQAAEQAVAAVQTWSIEELKSSLLNLVRGADIPECTLRNVRAIIRSRTDEEKRTLYDAEGNTIPRLISAALDGNSPAFLTALIEACPNEIQRTVFTRQDADGRNILHLMTGSYRCRSALPQFDSEVLEKILLQKDELKQTALIGALTDSSGVVSIYKRAFARGIGRKALVEPNFDGKLPLMEAQDAELCCYLLRETRKEMGDELWLYQPRNGETVLHHAIRGKKIYFKQFVHDCPKEHLETLLLTRGGYQEVQPLQHLGQARFGFMFNRDGVDIEDLQLLIGKVSIDVLHEALEAKTAPESIPFARVQPTGFTLRLKVAEHAATFMACYGDRWFEELVRPAEENFTPCHWAFLAAPCPWKDYPLKLDQWKQAMLLEEVGGATPLSLRLGKSGLFAKTYEWLKESFGDKEAHRLALLTDREGNGAMHSLVRQVDDGWFDSQYLLPDLLKYFSDQILTPNNFGITPLDIVLKTGHPKVFGTLLQNLKQGQASEHIRHQAGARNILHWAALHNPSKGEMLLELKAYRSWRSVENTEGMRPIDIWCSRPAGRLEGIEHLWPAEDKMPESLSILLEDPDDIANLVFQCLTERSGNRAHRMNFPGMRELLKELHILDSRTAQELLFYEFRMNPELPLTADGVRRVRKISRLSPHYRVALQTHPSLGEVELVAEDELLQSFAFGRGNELDSYFGLSHEEQMRWLLCARILRARRALEVCSKIILDTIPLQGSTKHERARLIAALQVIEVTGVRPAGKVTAAIISLLEHQRSAVRSAAALALAKSEPDHTDKSTIDALQNALINERRSSVIASLLEALSIYELKERHNLGKHLIKLVKRCKPVFIQQLVDCLMLQGQERYLKLAYQLVLKPEWKELESNEQFSLGRRGHAALFLTPSVFQTSATVIKARIAERLVELYRPKLQQEIEQRMHDADRSPSLRQLAENIRSIGGSIRHLPMFIFYPENAVLMRGYCDRAGEHLTAAAVNDFTLKGTGSCDLSNFHFNADKGTWTKLGQQFFTPRIRTVVRYLNTDGMLLLTSGAHTNEEQLRGHVRYESEGQSLHTVLTTDVRITKLRRVLMNPDHVKVLHNRVKTAEEDTSNELSATESVISTRNFFTATGNSKPLIGRVKEFNLEQSLQAQVETLVEQTQLKEVSEQELIRENQERQCVREYLAEHLEDDVLRGLMKEMVTVKAMYFKQA